MWSGEYLAEGSTLHYTRYDDLETIYIPGPIKQPLSVYVSTQNTVGIQW